jgi:pilus assembly protein FimV
VTPAPVAAATAAPVPGEAPAPAPEATPWFLNPFVLGGAGLVLIGGLVLGLRRTRKPPEEVVIGGGNRISEDDALRASLARTRANTTAAKPEPAKPAPAPDSSTVKRMQATPTPVPGAPAPVIVTPPADLDLEHALGGVRARPNDLESHLSLLRLYHARGNAVDYEAAAQGMRMHVGSPTDPRWREAVVMGASLMPGHPLFSQAGWNAPRFGDEAARETPRAPEPAPVAPPPTVAAPAIPAAPVAAVASAASSMPEVEELDVDAEWDKAMNEARGDSEGLDIDFEPPPDDLHRAEAEVMAEDEASATRIELAKAYLDIGDLEGARSMLEEVFNDGGPAAKAEAQRILKEIG